MAYGTKYRFTFRSTNGATCRILIQKDGYSGTIKDRPLGRAPVLKRKHSGRVYGTSLEIYAECNTDGEFAELYTSNPTEFRVQLYVDNSLRWSGFVSPELYSEPDVAPPYDVEIVATDGLGELKLHTFEAQGEMTLQGLFLHLLSFTGLSATVNYISNLSARDSAGNSISTAALWSTALINVDYKAGKTCYDVLQHLLDTLCASITYKNTQWLLWRDNDATASTLSYMDVGSIGSGGLWPIGNLVSSIEPAKNQVTIEAPFRRWTPVANPDMLADIGWTKMGATYDTEARAYDTGINQGVNRIEQSLTVDLSQGFQVVTKQGSRYGVMEYTGSGGDLIFTPAGSSQAFYLCDKGNNSGLRWYKYEDIYPARQDQGWAYGLQINVGPQGSARETTIDIPAFDVSDYSQTGTLQIKLWGRPAYSLIYSFYLYRHINKGYRDILKINNGARGEGDKVEIAQGRVVSSMTSVYYGYLRGVLQTAGGRFITSFADRNFASYADFLTLTAKNYARLVALPRLRFSGRLDTPSGFGVPPMLLRKGSVDYLVESYSWDMLNDEMEVEAVSLPSGTLDVQSETVISTTSESSSGESSGGSSGGSYSVQSDWDVTDRTSLAFIKNKPTIPSAPGTLITNLSTAQTVSEGESLSGTIRLHKVAKTGAYSDLRGTPDLSVYVVNSDLLNYIGKVTSATANNVAVFAGGGGLADSGIAKSGLALLAGDQTFTGNNTFQNTVRANGGVIAHGVTLSDLSDAIYAKVGTNTIKPIFRIYTDETSGQGDLNFGVDPGAGGTATHDVNFVGKRIIFRNANYADTGSTALQLNNTQIEANRNVVPNANRTYDIGAHELQWRHLFANRWYPNGASGPYIEYDSARTAFKVTGNMYVTGFLTAGASGQNDVQSSISYSLVPTQSGAYNLGSEGSKFGTLYANTVRATSIYTTDLTVTNLNYVNWVTWGSEDNSFLDLLDGSTHSNMAFSTYGIGTSVFADIISGKIVTIKFYDNEEDIMHITEAHLSGSRYITIYFGRKFRLVQTSATRFTIYGTLN
jgi:hypothetical protein